MAPRTISFIVLAGFIVLVALQVFRVLAPFLLPLFLALLLVVMFRPLHTWFTVQTGGRTRLAAGLTTLAVTLMVLLPLLLIGWLAVRDGVAMLSRLEAHGVEEKLGRLRQRLGLDTPLSNESLQTTVPRFDNVLSELDEMARQQRTVEELSAAAVRARREVALLSKELATRREQPEPYDDDDSLERLAQLDAQLQSIDRQLARVEERRLSHDEYSETLSGVRADFQDFRRAATGGRWFELLMPVANPSLDEEQLKELGGRVRQYAADYALATTQVVGSVIGGVVVGLFVLVIAFYYFLADGPSMVNSFMRLSPIDDRYERELIGEFDRISRAVVVATLLSAVVQGLLAGIGYYFAGIPALFLLTMLTMLLALVPFVGAAAVWIPCCLWLLFSEERYFAAAMLAVYGGTVVSMADNVIKPWILHGQSKLHPLLALLSVLGGVQALGPIGIFVGPMVVAFLQVLLHILEKELRELGRSSEAALATTTTPLGTVPRA